MSKAGLSKEEIKKRLIRLRNIERLHTEQKMRVELLKEEIQLLKKVKSGGSAFRYQPQK